MPFKLSRKITLLLGLLTIFIIFMGYIAYTEIHNNTSQTPTASPTPTEYPNYSTSTPLVTNYSITIPEFRKVGFGIAEINMKFIAPKPSLQNQQITSEANYSTTILPITLSTNSSNTSLILPPVLNGTSILVNVDVYSYTMSTDNPRILVASQQWHETKYVYM